MNEPTCEQTLVDLWHIVDPDRVHREAGRSLTELIVFLHNRRESELQAEAECVQIARRIDSSCATTYLPGKALDRVRWLQDSLREWSRHNDGVNREARDDRQEKLFRYLEEWAAGYIHPDLVPAKEPLRTVTANPDKAPDQTHKADAGKPSLLPLLTMPIQALAAVAAVRAHGIQKYGPDFRDVARERWLDAILRHLHAAMMEPGSKDAESGQDHLAHVAVSAILAMAVK